MPQRVISSSSRDAGPAGAGAHGLFDRPPVLAQAVGLRELEKERAGFLARGPALRRHGTNSSCGPAGGAPSKPSKPESIAGCTAKCAASAEF